MSEPLLRLVDAAAELSLSLSTIKRAIASGDLPVVRVGAAVRIRPNDLRRFVAARTERRSPGSGSVAGDAGVVVAKGARLWD